MARRTAARPKRKTKPKARPKSKPRRKAAKKAAKKTIRKPVTKRRRASAARRAPARAAKPARKTARAKRAVGRAPKKAAPTPKATQTPVQRGRVRPGVRGGKAPRLDRLRRTLEEENVPTPPSSLDLDRHPSAARSGRAEMAQSRRQHAGMTPGITAGDPDASVENAYFSGEEAPGGDNSTPDQDIVDEIGKAVGIEYQDNEELRSGDKVAARDRHRWELDPASSDDYKDRD